MTPIALAAAHAARHGGHIHVTGTQAAFGMLIAGLLVAYAVYRLIPGGPKVGGRRVPPPQPRRPW